MFHNEEIDLKEIGVNMKTELVYLRIWFIEVLISISHAVR